MCFLCSINDERGNITFYLVNGLEFLRDGKDGLDVVVAQFLDQMGDGGIVLSKDSSTKTNKTNARYRQ